MVAVKVDDIDGLAHEGAVDAVAFREQQAFVECQRRGQHEAAQTGGVTVGETEGKRVCAACGVDRGEKREAGSGSGKGHWGFCITFIASENIDHLALARMGNRRQTIDLGDFYTIYRVKN